MLDYSSPHFTAADAHLTRQIGIVDTHNDLASAIIHRRFQGTYDSLGTYWLPRLEAGGVHLVVCPVWIDSPYLPHSAMQHAVRVIDGLYAEDPRQPRSHRACSLLPRYRAHQPPGQ